jgi:hypothetical protein
MADMEEVKTTVGKDDFFPLCLQVFNDPMKFFSFFDLFFHHPSYSIPTRFNEGSQHREGPFLDKPFEFL